MRRAAAAGLLLLAAYVGLSFLNSPRGFLGSDTGAKVATLERMTERGRFDPDLGHWAGRWDPRKQVHPMAFTGRTSTGKWSSVSTLPALWVGWQLYRVGGYRAALLVPMVGAVAAALVGRALLRRLGVGQRWAWGGFALLGLGSPLTIYALDFWEHSLGVALMGGAVLVLTDAVAPPATAGRAWRFAAAGVLLGTAATMRTEGFVYLAVSAVAATAFCAWHLRSGDVPDAQSIERLPRSATRPPVRGAGAVLLLPVVLLAAAAVPLVANERFERRVLGTTLRVTRTRGTAAEIGTFPASRLREGAVTSLGLEGSDAGIVLGLVFVALLVFASLRRDRSLACFAAAGAGALLLLRAAASGLGFVPGLGPAWVTASASAASLARAGRRGGRDDPLDGPTSDDGVEAHGSDGTDPPGRSRGVPAPWALPVTVAVGALPLVVGTQYLGGAEPQWAGRYLLVSGFLLAVVGWAALERRPRPLAFAFVALAAAVTGFGLTWMSVRTHAVAAAVETIEVRPEPVIVSGVYHLSREGGATYGRKRWLTLAPTARPADAVRALDGAGIDRFASVQVAGERRLDFPGFSPTTTDPVRLFAGVDLRVTSWERAP